MHARLLLLLFAALSLASCEAPPPEAPAPTPDTTAAAPPDTVAVELEGVDDLVGDWLVTEKPGSAPEEGPSVVTFTRTGEYTVRDDDGIVETATYRPLGPDLIAITDSAGTREFEYARVGQTLTLTAPGTESTTVMERR